MEQFRRRSRAATLRGGLVLLLLMVLVALVLGFPFLMVQLPVDALPWDRLADVGEAYGGASALLAAMALCGVGASLIFQQRQLRHQLMVADRQQHLELVKLGLNDPNLMATVDLDFAASSTVRQIAYLNLFMGYWKTMWLWDELSDERLRALVSTAFQSPDSRAWWQKYGDLWKFDSPRDRRFIEIVTAAHAASTSRSQQPAARPRGRFAGRNSRWLT